MTSWSVLLVAAAVVVMLCTLAVCTLRNVVHQACQFSP